MTNDDVILNYLERTGREIVQSLQRQEVLGAEINKKDSIINFFKWLYIAFFILVWIYSNDFFLILLIATFIMSSLQVALFIRMVKKYKKATHKIKIKDEILTHLRDSFLDRLK